MEYGWLSLLPPFIAIVLAITTRRVIVSLLLAVFVGVALLNVYDPGTGQWSFVALPMAVWSMVVDHMWVEFREGKPLNVFTSIGKLFQGDLPGARSAVSALTDSDRIRVYYFTILFGALVGILYAAGGMRSLVLAMAKRVSSRCGGQVLVWLSGMIIFFDDYANTILIGTTMRDTADRLKFSREKLSYIVDSTSAPIAGVALISTWVATEIGYMSDGLNVATTKVDINGFELFIQSLPYRFYPLFALFLVAVVAVTGRDVGPMKESERQAFNRETSGTDEDESNRHAYAPAWTAIISISATIFVIGFRLFRTGEVEDPTVTGLEYWGQYVGNADPYSALIWGGFAGCVVAFVTSVVFGKQSWRSLVSGAMAGVKNLGIALLILLLAWTLTRLTKTEFLDTQGYLGNWIRDANIWPGLIPTMVFLLSGVVAFSTGTSWGTMGLLIPLSIPVSLAASPDLALLSATTGSVLAGAIFGDHCSPISDTTVLSSQASGCDHIAHVKTQMPYAVLAGAITILVGTIPAGLGLSPWISLVLGCGALIGIMLYFGEKPQAESVELEGLNSQNTPRVD